MDQDKKRGNGMEWKKGIIVLWVLSGISLAITVRLFLSSPEKNAGQGRETASPDGLEVYAWYDERETFEALSKGFMEEYPGLKVNMHYFPNSESQQSYLALLNGQEAVDIIAVATSPDAVQLINKGYITALDGFIEEGGSDLGGLFPIVESLRQDGKVYMLPYRNSCWVVYYNKKIFDRMGEAYPEGEWTWEDYALLAQRLASEENGWYGSLNYESGWWAAPVRTAGAENPLKEKDLAAFVEAARWCYDLTYNRKAAMPYGNLTGMDSKDYIGRFLSGEAAMMYSGEWCLSMLNERIESEELDFVYDVAPMPSWKEEKSFAIGDPASLLMAEKSQQKELAFLFMQYVCGEKGARQLAARHFLPAWESEEIRQIFQDSMDMPAHAAYFFQNKERSVIPAATDYMAAMSLLHDNIWVFLTCEVTLEEAMGNYRAQLAERQVP